MGFSDIWKQLKHAATYNEDYVYPKHTTDILHTSYYTIRSTNRLLPVRLISFGLNRLLEKTHQLATGGMNIRFDERLIEYPLVYKQLPSSKDMKILDIGCASSLFSLSLASTGYKVWGLDGRDYPFQHPNLTFKKEDFFKNTLPDNFFDIVIAISTLEHMGSGEYGESIPDGYKKAMAEMKRVTKENGKILLTVPYGILHKPSGDSWIFDEETLMALVKEQGLKINTKEHYTIKEGKWMPASMEDAAKTPSDKWPVRAIAFMELQK